MNITNNLVQIFLLSAIMFTAFDDKINAQDFLEVKYSINDIKKQREIFKKEIIKSVTEITSNRENRYEIDIEGKIISVKEKSSNEIDVSYSYDLKNNLTSILYRLAPDEFEYDKNGNVIKKFGEEYTIICSYDSQNKLIKENVESDFECCSFEKIFYNELLMIEIIYPCCEGNYAMRYVYEYSDSEQLLKMLNYTKNCSSGLEEQTKTEEYFYNDTSKLPYKMIKDNQEINFVYEYYE